MKDYAKAYKAYDIRGIYGEQVDTTLAYAVGRAVARQVIAQEGEEASVLVGCDVREYNNQLIYYFLKGCEDEGCDNFVGIGLPVENVGNQKQGWGVASSAMCYFLNKDICTIGAPFTASHLTAEYAGMKLVDKSSHLIETAVIKEWVGDIYTQQPETYDEADFQRLLAKVNDPQHPLRAKIAARYQLLLDILSEKFAALGRTYTFVVDFCNGAGVAYEKRMLEQLAATYGHTIIFLNDKADAYFSIHGSDTTSPENYNQLAEAVQAHKADFGIMFDGDADRLGFVDNTGTVIGGDTVVAVITKNILKKLPAWQAVVYDVTSTQAIVDVIMQHKWVPVSSKVGHRFIKEKFDAHNAVFGWELSGHLFFKESWWLESPLIALYHLMDEMAWYENAAAMIAAIMPYYKPALVNYEVHDKDVVLQGLEDHFAAYEIDRTDGIRVNMQDFWFLVRASNTEPIIRVYSEAKNKTIRQEKMKEVNEVLGV